jgi:transposase
MTTAKREQLGAPAWNRIYHYFNMRQEDCMKHYHHRSNVEALFYMIKNKFKHYAKNKDESCQFNEVLLKILCHNIYILHFRQYPWIGEID